MVTRRLVDLKDGSIEETLDENGTYGLGNQVRSTYFIHFFNKSVETSSQRQQ
jgi:hypothetical protein